MQLIIVKFLFLKKYQVIQASYRLIICNNIKYLMLMRGQ